MLWCKARDQGWDSPMMWLFNPPHLRPATHHQRASPNSHRRRRQSGVRGASCRGGAPPSGARRVPVADRRRRRRRAARGGGFLHRPRQQGVDVLSRHRQGIGWFMPVTDRISQRFRGYMGSAERRDAMADVQRPTRAPGATLALHLTDMSNNVLFDDVLAPAGLEPTRPLSASFTVASLIALYLEATSSSSTRQGA